MGIGKLLRYRSFLYANLEERVTRLSAGVVIAISMKGQHREIVGGYRQ